MSISRRQLFGLAGSAGIGAVVAAPVTYTITAQQLDASHTGVAFFGEHQAGITTPIQDHGYFAIFSAVTGDGGTLRSTLREMSLAAERMTRGDGAGLIGPVDGVLDAPPDDTGEALGLPPSRLTVTIGYGNSIFDGRFGLAARKPSGLIEMPVFARDNADGINRNGDIMVQICADNQQVAFHAARNLIRIAKGVLVVTWAQAGFSGSSHSGSQAPTTPRNLLGFKDGTANLNTSDQDQVDRWLWTDDEWFSGGTYAAVRRFNFAVETWDRAPLREQQDIFGRTKDTGAPLSGGTEFSEPDFDASSDSGEPSIAKDAHMRLAHPSRHGGAKILRRAFNFAGGVDEVGRLSAGLLFVSFQKSLTDQFVPIQRALSNSDLLNEYIVVTASAAFACPPGLTRGDDWGSQLFG